MCGFYERLVYDYGVKCPDADKVDRASLGYNRLQREVMKAFNLGFRTSHVGFEQLLEEKAKNSKFSVDEIIDMDYYDSGCSAKYAVVLNEIFSDRKSNTARLAEIDWDDQMRNCLYLEDRLHGALSAFDKDKVLKEKFIAGRVILQRMIDNDTLKGKYFLPGIDDFKIAC